MGSKESVHSETSQQLTDRLGGRVVFAALMFFAALPVATKPCCASVLIDDRAEHRVS